VSNIARLHGVRWEQGFPPMAIAPCIVVSLALLLAMVKALGHAQGFVWQLELSGISRRSSPLLYALSPIAGSVVLHLPVSTRPAYR
jgi:hypothetical protein